MYKQTKLFSTTAKFDLDKPTTYKRKMPDLLINFSSHEGAAFII